MRPQSTLSQGKKAHEMRPVNSLSLANKVLFKMEKEKIKKENELR